MMAARLPGILPTLTPKSSGDRDHSVAGMIARDSYPRPAFRPRPLGSMAALRAAALSQARRSAGQ